MRRRVYSRSLSSFAYALRVVGFIRSRCVHSGAPWGTSDPLEGVGFIQVHPGGRWFIGGRWVHRGSLGSLGVIWFIRVRLAVCRVHSVSLYAPLVSSGSFGVVRFIWVRPGGRRINSATLGSFGCSLGVVGFLRGRWVHSGSPWGLSDSFWGVGFIRVRSWGRWVHWGSFGSIECALSVDGFVGGHCGFIRVLPGVCRVYSVLLCSFLGALVVVGFIRVVRFIRAHPGGGWVQGVLVHSGVPCGSLS